jgi:hypothetical protein
MIHSTIYCRYHVSLDEFVDHKNSSDPISPGEEALSQRTIALVDEDTTTSEYLPTTIISG